VRLGTLSTDESRPLPEELSSRHAPAGFAAVGLASDTLSRAALRARRRRFWRRTSCRSSASCQSNDHEHTTSICNLGEAKLASRASTE
jgi:hypothetical protein